MKKNNVISLTLLLVVMFVSSAYSHCQIPCGIYGDKNRFETIEEHITTLEKSIKKIKEVSSTKPVDHNQLVRWVTNKDAHGVELQNIVNHYFVAQRIKMVSKDDRPKYKVYQAELILLHRLVVYAMKCKQTTDIAYIQKLRETLSKFEDIYFKNLPKKK